MHTVLVLLRVNDYNREIRLRISVKDNKKFISRKKTKFYIKLQKHFIL